MISTMNHKVWRKPRKLNETAFDASNLGFLWCTLLKQILWTEIKSKELHNFIVVAHKKILSIDITLIRIYWKHNFQNVHNFFFSS